MRGFWIPGLALAIVLSLSASPIATAGIAAVAAILECESLRFYNSAAATSYVNLRKLHNPEDRPEGGLRASSLYDGIIILFARMTKQTKVFAAAMLGPFSVTQLTLTQRGKVVKKVLLEGKQNIGHTFFATTIFPRVRDLAAQTPAADVVDAVTGFLHDHLDAIREKDGTSYTEKRIQDFLDPTSGYGGYCGSGTVCPHSDRSLP